MPFRDGTPTLQEIEDARLKDKEKVDKGPRLVFKPWFFKKQLY